MVGVDGVGGLCGGWGGTGGKCVQGRSGSEVEVKLVRCE